MKYAIDVREMLHGTHLLYICDTEEDANYLLNIISHQNTKSETEMEFYMNEFSISVIEDVDFRNLEKFMENVPYQINEGGYVSTKYSDIEIINYNVAIDLY